MPQVTLPVAGVAYNVNSSLGHDGIVGVKTGSGPRRRVPGLRCHPGGRGQPGNDRRRRAGRTGNLRPAERPWRRDFRRREPPQQRRRGPGARPDRQPGAVLGTVSSAWTAGPAAVAATGVSVTAWPGTPVTITVTPRPLGHAISQGQPIAYATVTIGSQVNHITLDASQGRAGTVGALAPHPALTGPEPERNPAKARTRTRRAALGPPVSPARPLRSLSTRSAVPPSLAARQARGGRSRGRRAGAARLDAHRVWPTPSCIRRHPRNLGRSRAAALARYSHRTPRKPGAASTRRSAPTSLTGRFSVPAYCLHMANGYGASAGSPDRRIARAAAGRPRRLRRHGLRSLGRPSPPRAPGIRDPAAGATSPPATN